MKCLMKYQWVKLPRNHLPEGKGIMNAWAKLASRAAFRKGQALYWALGSSMNWRPAISLFLDVTAPIS